MSHSGEPKTPDMVPPILRSEQDSRWLGFPFLVQRAPAAGRWDGFDSPNYWVSVIVSGAYSVRLQSGARDKDVYLSTGSFCGYPAGQHWDVLHWSCRPVESMSVSCDCSRLRALRLAPEETLPALGATYRSSTDQGVTTIVANMRRELEMGCLSGRLYAESLSLALAARLRGIALESRAAHSYNARPMLAPSQARLLSEFVDASLAQDLSIGDLANLTRMSASHFARRFRNTFEMPVHRYVLHRRVERAIRLLSLDNQSIAEVALECGFANQSHFTEAFRRIIGTTPHRYRRRVG
jgi:AraC family transcriptional regulator